MPAASNKRQPKRRKQGAKTRDAILAAAERIFARSGFAGARTDAIVAAAKVNKALLYYYFESKAKLYEAVIEEHFRDFNAKAVEVLNGPGSARVVLIRYVGLHFDFISARQRYAPLYHQVMSATTRDRLVREHFLPRGKALGELLKRGMHEGEFRKADIFNTAMSITALIVFYFSAARVLHILGRPDAYSKAHLKKRKQEVFEFIQHALFADPSAPMP